MKKAIMFFIFLLTCLFGCNSQANEAIKLCKEKINYDKNTIKAGNYVAILSKKNDAVTYQLVDQKNIIWTYHEYKLTEADKLNGTISQGEVTMRINGPGKTDYGWIENDKEVSIANCLYKKLKDGEPIVDLGFEGELSDAHIFKHIPGYTNHETEKIVR